MSSSKLPNKELKVLLEPCHIPSQLSPFQTPEKAETRVRNRRHSQKSCCSCESFTSPSETRKRRTKRKQTQQLVAENQHLKKVVRTLRSETVLLRKMLTRSQSKLQKDVIPQPPIAPALEFLNDASPEPQTAVDFEPLREEANARPRAATPSHCSCADDVLWLAELCESSGGIEELDEALARPSHTTRRICRLLPGDIVTMQDICTQLDTIDLYK
ncbi:hypothetical protein ACJJTC_012890 [Scirpophaga incertulas]